MTFWKAIDAICKAGNLHAVPDDRTSGGGLDGMLGLLDGPITGSGPVSDDGAFRVQLLSVHYQSDIQLNQTGPSQSATKTQVTISPDQTSPLVSTNREFFLQFALSAEPRLSVTRNGSIKLTQAVDDQGRSLLGSAGSSDSIQLTSGYQGLSPSSVLRLRVDLEYPALPAGRIKILRGTIPVIVTARKSDPLVVPLAESRGKLFRNDDSALTLLDYRPASMQQPATVQISIRPFGAAAEPHNPGNGEPLGYRPDSFQHQVEILDAQGKPLSWFPSSSLFDGEETRLTMTVGTRGASGIPTTIRYHGILKANADVAFEFCDIPIP